VIYKKMFNLKESKIWDSINKTRQPCIRSWCTDMHSVYFWKEVAEKFRGKSRSQKSSKYKPSIKTCHNQEKGWILTYVKIKAESGRQNIQI